MKRAIVTGGTRGIGLAIARRLQRNGYSILVTGTKCEKDLGFACHQVEADFLCGGAWVNVLKKLDALGWKAIDVLVNNAGIAKAIKLEDTSYSDLQDMMAVNATTPLILTTMLLPHFKANGGGSIINITSISGLTGFSTMGAYCMSKFALTALGLVAAKEYAKYNIRVNNVCPGPTDTDMWTELDKQYKAINGWKDDTESEQAYLSKLLIKRLGHVEDVAAAVEFLVDDNRANYITGVNFKVCGGNIIG